MHPVPGNHEYQTPNAQGYRDYFGYGPSQPLYYSWDIGAWHLIALDSETSTALGSPQELWLRADLAAHPATCTLAYWHKPLFSSGEHGANIVARPLWDDLFAAGADVVLNGHDHDYERFAPQDPAGVADPWHGLREFVVGTGGKSHYPIVTIQPNSEIQNTTVFGVLQLTLHADTYDWQFVPEAGATFSDAGSGTCTSPSVDVNAPTAPADLTGTAIDAHTVELGWTEATDDVGVVGYEVFRDGISIANLGSVAAFTDVTAPSGSTLSYTVRARDAAGNRSPLSAPFSVVTPPQTGIVLVQQAIASGSAATLAPTLQATSAGDALVAAVAIAAGSSANVLGVTDSSGGTWTRGAVGYQSGSNSRIEIWYRLGAPSVTSVTVSLSAAKLAAVNLTEWSRVGSVLDGAGGAGSASATTVTTPPVTTARSPDLVIGAVNYAGSFASTLTSTSFTGLTLFGAGTAVHGRAAYVVTSAPGTYQPSWTLNGASGGSGGAIVAFTAAP
jgi:hypothetical protein